MDLLTEEKSILKNANNLGNLVFEIKNIEDNKVTCVFYNSKQFIVISDMEYDSVQYFTNEKIKENGYYTFKTDVSGFDLDNIVYKIAILIVGFGAYYNKKEFLNNDTTHKFNDVTEIFISSLVNSYLTYIKTIALNGHPKEDLYKVLDVLDELIEEFVNKNKQID